METNINKSFAKYMNDGFILIMDTRLVPLSLLGDHDRPNIGFGFHDGLSFGFGCLGFGLGFAKGKNGGKCWVNEGNPMLWVY